MKNILLAVMTALLPLIFCGCAPTVEIDGVRYTALTERQRAEMVRFCRLSIKKNAKGKLTPQEVTFVMKNRPEIRIQYTGDCFGYATVAWHLQTKTIEMKFIGDLTAEYPHVMFGISAPEAPRVGIQPDKSIY